MPIRSEVTETKVDTEDVHDAQSASDNAFGMIPRIACFFTRSALFIL